MPEYRLRMMATARVAGYAEITVNSDAAAEAAVKKMGPGDFEFQIDDDFGIEGDEVVFVPHLDEVEEGEDASIKEFEVDVRQPGEPFSWDCVKLVKDLATLDPDSMKDRYRVMRLVRQAKALMKTPEAS